MIATATILVLTPLTTGVTEGALIAAELATVVRGSLVALVVASCVHFQLGQDEAPSAS
jgi:multidrug efflux pump subunit AcrB